MKRKPSTMTLKRKLDRKVSEMVRARDSGKPCISCGKVTYLQAGHFVKRKPLPTRWHPWNVNGECISCNGFDESHIIGYYNGLEKRYGKGVGEELFRLSRIRWKVLPDQLERLILACNDPSDYESEWFAVQREFSELQ